MNPSTDISPRATSSSKILRWSASAISATTKSRPFWPNRIHPFGHNMIDPFGPNNINRLTQELLEIFCVDLRTRV
ncbi:hypothetical protein, partial [Heminiphilus faecis]|uniref:hypothetical protein n=1 Tax=Heminiphilus faecis TaxID=2601703 RepID=UPI001967E8A1